MWKKVLEELNKGEDKEERTPNQQYIFDQFHSQKFRVERQIMLSSKKMTTDDIHFMVREMPIRLVKILLLYCPTDSDAARELALGNWPNLQQLTIFGGQQFGDEGCRQLASLRAKNLKQCCLPENHIGVEGCKHLANANWKQLSSISLGDNPIGEEGLIHIMRIIKQNIVTLSLGKCNIGGKEVKLLSNRRWMNLTTLSLSNNSIGDVGCKWLSHSEWGSLNQLYIDNWCYGQSNNITKAGCKWLSKSSWKQLTVFYLSNNQVFWEGGSQLNRGDWPELEQLKIQSTRDYRRRKYSPYRDNRSFYLMKSNWRCIKSDLEYYQSKDLCFTDIGFGFE